jgi:Relaxase/Mobilisation nuclease domain
MVTRITTGKDIVGLIMYNEKEQSTVLYANRIRAEKELEELTIADKVQAFSFNLSRNARTEKTTFHVSLNPDPSDKLTDDQLRDIAIDYMEGMKYGNQPYLVYKHTDIERMHIHIVSIRVDAKGKKIDSAFERMRSDELRKDLEIKYQLKQTGQAQTNRVGEGARIKPIQIEKVIYGKDETKRAIASVVRAVMQDYKFTSMAEYKAIIQQFNVTLEEVHSAPTAPIQKQGIVYSMINEAGQKQGKVIKSSLIDKTVGLEAIKQKMEQSQTHKKDETLKSSTTKRIDQALSDIADNPTKENFKTELAKHNIIPAYIINETNRLYGIHFIDQKSKTAWSGRELGKAYSAHQLNDKFTKSESPTSSPVQETNKTKTPSSQKESTNPKSTQPTTRAEVPQQHIAMRPTTISDLVNALFDTEQTTQKQENKAKKKKRKKIQI